MLVLLLACAGVPAGDAVPTSDSGGLPCADPVQGWLDDDGDGFGGEAEEACEAQWYWVSVGGDCDDDDPLIHPDALELCEPWSRGVDEDCDGKLDGEDGDCRDECLEDDCADGYDQDDDGLTDCEDDDCLGTADCADFTVVMSGGGPFALSRFPNSQQLLASSIQGHVVFHSGILGSCDFIVGRVEMWTYSGLTTDVRREGIFPGDGCASSLTTGFLPRTSELTFSGRMPVIPGGGPWYGSTLTSTQAGYSTVVYRGTLGPGSPWSR